MESNVYLEAGREWDERYADLVRGKHNWQIAAAPGASEDSRRAICMVGQSSLDAQPSLTTCGKHANMFNTCHG